MDFFLSTILDPTDFQGIYSRLSRIEPLLSKRNWDRAFVRALEKMHAACAGASWKLRQEGAPVLTTTGNRSLDLKQWHDAVTRAHYEKLSYLEKIHDAASTLRSFMQVIEHLKVSSWPDPPAPQDKAGVGTWCRKVLALVRQKSATPCALSIDGYQLCIAVDQLPSPYLVELAGTIRTLAASFGLANPCTLQTPSRFEGITLKEVREPIEAIEGQLQTEGVVVAESATALTTAFTTDLNFESFPRKQKSLLDTLLGKGDVPVAEVLRNLYGSTAKTKRTALSKLTDRVNDGLAKKRLAVTISRKGDALCLEDANRSSEK